MSDDGMSWGNVKSRRFRNINGFEDGAYYLEVSECEPTIFHHEDGSSKRSVSHCYDLKTCLEFVEQCVWEEIFPSRKFRHVNGFKNNTECVEISEDGKCIVHGENGLRLQLHEHSLEDCLQLVRRDIWEEVTEELVKMNKPESPKMRDLREDEQPDKDDFDVQLLYAPYIPLTIPYGVSRKKYMKKLRKALRRQKLKQIIKRIWESIGG